MRSQENSIFIYVANKCPLHWLMFDLVVDINMPDASVLVCARRCAHHATGR